MNSTNSHNGWTETTLGEVVKIANGGTPSTKNISFWDGNIPWITPKDLSNFKGVYISRGERNITEVGLKNSSAQLLPKNTLLFSSRAPIGYIAIAQNEVATNQGFKNVICDEKHTHFRFIYYWLITKKNYVEKLSSGSTFSEASATVMKSLSIFLPPLAEQQRIANILSAFDDKIELLRQQNQTLEAMAQTIFKEWFVDFRFPGAGEMVESELGVIPEGWRIGVLKDEFEIIMGQSPKGESYNENSVGMIFFQGRAEFTDRFPAIRLFTTEPKRVAEKFDVLVSVRAPVGDMNVAFNKCCIGRGLGAVRGKYKSYSLYKTKSLMDLFKKFEAEGTVFGSINKGGFEGIQTIIPDIDTIKNFDDITSPIDQKIFNNYNQIQTLSNLRDTLLPKLMNGKVRVN